MQLSMLRNSVALIAAKVAAMGLGFLFWLLAARLFAKDDVGIAAGVVSAMILGTQLAVLGVGSAVIRLFPGHQSRPAPLLDAALALAVVTSAVTAGVFLVLAATVLGELGAVTESPSYALLFVAATVLGTVGIVLDQISTVLRRGDQALLRGVGFGLTTVVLVAAIAQLRDDAGSEALLIPWVAAGAVAAALGAWQLRRTLPGYRARPRIARPLASALLRTGLPNWMLTLSERAPGLLLPVIVVEILSPSANASWYTAWMMAWIVFIVPIQVGITLFAEVSHDPAALESSLRRALRVCLGIGVPAALAVAVIADPLLSVLGESYARDGVTPLRILVAGVIPLTFIQAYFATCRGTGRLREAIATGWVTGTASVVAAAFAGAAGGLDAMAVAWVGTQLAAGAWAALRLVRLRSQRAHPAGPDRPVTIIAA